MATPSPEFDLTPELERLMQLILETGGGAT
jgi:hypothetical protein